MRFFIAAAALLSGVSAQYGYGGSNSTSYTTEVVTQYTTYCPGPTQITHGTETYTVTSETTLTITNCPCTITRPVTTPVYTPPPVTSTYVPPQPTYTPPPYNNGTTYVPPPTTAPSSPPPYTSPTGVPVPTGAANRAVVGSGAGLAAVLGFAAYVL